MEIAHRPRGIESLAPPQQAALAAAVRGRLVRAAGRSWEADGMAVHPSVVEGFESDGWVVVASGSARATPEGVRRLALARGIVPVGVSFSVKESPPSVIAHWGDGSDGSVTVGRLPTLSECKEAARSLAERLGHARS